MAGIGRGKRQYRMHFEEESGRPPRACPKCDRRMRQRQQTFAVYLPPAETRGVCVPCRYCPACDFLETRWDSLESRLGAEAILTRPDLPGATCLVLGTVDEPGAGGWASFSLPHDLVPEVLHEFREVVTTADRARADARH
jgi:hypothetical protein